MAGSNHEVVSQSKSENPARNQEGMSLVEMLVTMAIMGIILAGTSEMVLINNSGTLTLFNKVDSLNSSRQFVERLGKIVRMARNVGDIYGEHVLNPSPPPIYSNDSASNYFPSPLDPNYGGGETPAGGWPSAPWPAQPYTLSNQTLIVQLPVFDVNGWPTMIAKGSGTPAAATNLDNVDTYVFQVLSDPNNAGEYEVQEATFRGVGSTQVLMNPPVTIMNGIIGPINPSTGAPQIFQFIASGSAAPLDTVPNVPNSVTAVTGVSLNLEVKRSGGDKNTPQSLGIHSEIFMRNNTLATTTGSG